MLVGTFALWVSMSVPSTEIRCHSSVLRLRAEPSTDAIDHCTLQALVGKDGLDDGEDDTAHVRLQI